VKVLDQYDGASVDTGRIHSLFVIHRVALSPEDANVNIIKVTSNIPLPYVYKIDGCSHFKEKEGSFTWWAKKYLEKSSM
jgi:hypothetical protein